MLKKTATQTIEPKDFLLPDPEHRRRAAARPARPLLVEDAVFEVVSASPRQHQRVNDNPPQSRKSDPPRLLPMLARMAGRLAAATERQLTRLSPQAFMTLLSSLAMLVFWMCGGFSALNAAASDRPDAPFALVDTAVHTQDANGMTVALVTGAVRNTSGKIIPAPRLAVVSGNRRDIIGTVTLSADRIGPGITIPFAGRFKLDGGKSTQISVIPEHP